MWQDVPVQLVDLPAISGFVEPWVPNVIRSGDAAVLVADLASDDVADASLAVLEKLEQTHTELVGELPFDNEDESTRHLKTVMVPTSSTATGSKTAWTSSANGPRRGFRSFPCRPPQARD